MDSIRAKLKASGIHLLISLAIFFCLLYIMITSWFPSPFFELEGGWQGVKILIFVDLILGPLLTFLVINKNKTTKQTFMDLSVIALIQVSALTWGVNNIYNQRIISISYATGPETAYAIRTSDLVNQSPEEIATIQALVKNNHNRLILAIRPHYKDYELASEVLTKVDKEIPEHAQAQILSQLLPSNAQLISPDNHFPVWLKFEGNFQKGKILIAKNGEILDLRTTPTENASDTN